jgi:hypothetical protein
MCHVKMPVVPNKEVRAMATMQMNRLSIYSHAEPAFDVRTIRRAASGVAEMIREFGPDSTVGTILTQTLRELRSLEPSAATTVIGPIRIAA